MRLNVQLARSMLLHSHRSSGASARGARKG